MISSRYVCVMLHIHRFNYSEASNWCEEMRTVRVNTILNGKEIDS